MVLGVCCYCMLPNVGGKRSLCMDIPHGKISKIHLLGPICLLPYLANILAHMYKKADFIITPSEYSKQLIQSYGVKTPIVAVSNGIDLSKYKKDPKKEEVFRKHFNIQEGEKVVLCAGLYFRRKGIEELCRSGSSDARCPLYLVGID